MAVNVELLDRTLAHIEAHPEDWFQGTWRCETGMCFAGTAASLAGGQWATPVTDDFHADRLVPEPGDDPAHVYECCDGLGHGPTVAARVRARRVLGLSEHDANGLFRGTNSLDDLRRIVSQIKDGAS